MLILIFMWDYASNYIHFPTHFDLFTINNKIKKTEKLLNFNTQTAL